MVEETTIIDKLQEKLATNTFNPREYNREQLGIIDNMIQEGVLQGPRVQDIIKQFNQTQTQIAKEKEFAKDPLAVALQDKSILSGDALGLIPTRPGAEFVGDMTGSLIPYLRNKEALVNSLKLPRAAQSKLFAEKAMALSTYLEKIPRIGKALKFTRGILMGAGKAADAATSARLKPLIMTEAQSLLGGAVGAGAGVVGYDLVNRSVGKDLAIAINNDLANLSDQEVESDTTLSALNAAKYSLLWGGAATATLPFLGALGKGAKAAFGLKNEKALALAQFAQEKGLPIPLLAAMNGGFLSSLGKSYFKTVGVFPFVSVIGDKALKEAEQATGRAYLKELAGLAPITKVSALSTASLDQFSKQFNKYSDVIASNYTALMNKAEDIGNPAIIKLDRTRARANEFIQSFGEMSPKFKEFKYVTDERDVLGQFGANYQKYIFDELSDNQDPLVQLMGFLNAAKSTPLTFKEFAGIQRLATRAIQRTSFQDARKSIFMLKEALDDDFALSFSKLTKEDLLKDAVVKAEYDLAITQGGSAAGDRVLAKKLEEAQGLNQGFKKANASFAYLLRPFEYGSVANAIKAANRNLFTNKQLYGIVGKESIPPDKVFRVIEDSVFKTGSPDAVEQLKVLYGYNASKEGKEMFNRAFTRHLYDTYLGAFSEETLTKGSTFDYLNNAIKAKPKSTIVSEVLERGAQDEFQAARGLTAREVLDGAGRENIQIKFGQGDYAEFSADKFANNLGLTGKNASQTRDALKKAYGGGAIGEEALANLDKFIGYTKVLSDVPISETSSFLQRRLTLGGGQSLLGGVVMGGGMFMANPLAPLVFLYASRKIGHILSNPKALRYMMDALSPEERLIAAQAEVGLKKLKGGIPVTIGEKKRRAFARFANYLADEDSDLPRVDPNNINDDEIIRRLSNAPITIPKQGYEYKDLPKEEKQRMFPERELQDKIPTSLLVDAEGFGTGFNLGEDQAINAVNEDYGVTSQTTNQGQGTTTAPAASQAPQGISAPAVETPQAKQAKVSSLFPFDFTSQAIAGQGETNVVS
jgi:hypothetical protein